MTDGVPLCCCEYFDVNHERNHILACCCNCVDVDEAFERLITFQKVSEGNKSSIMSIFSTFQDRLRIPWRGGAKQIAFDAALPIFIIPTMLILASISLWWTIFSFTTVSIFLALIFNFLIKTIPHTKFFFIWTITSVIVLYIIFEFIVIPFLEILLEENIALSIFIFGFVICWYLMKVRSKHLNKVGGGDIEFGKQGSRIQNCSICQMRIPDRDHHCVWFDCCVGKHNQCLFILSLFFAIGALLYSSNLTFTSVCHPFILYKTILLPDDCTEVYNLFELGLSFVSAVYSLLLAFLIFLVFLQQLLLVSLGMTTKEWRGLPLTSKLCLGLTARRPQNQGFFRNWSSIICWTRNNYAILNEA